MLTRRRFAVAALSTAALAARPKWTMAKVGSPSHLTEDAWEFTGPGNGRIVPFVDRARTLRRRQVDGQADGSHNRSFFTCDDLLNLTAAAASPYTVAEQLRSLAACKATRALDDALTAFARGGSRRTVRIDADVRALWLATVLAHEVRPGAVPVSGVIAGPLEGRDDQSAAMSATSIA